MSVDICFCIFSGFFAFNSWKMSSRKGTQKKAKKRQLEDEEITGGDEQVEEKEDVPKGKKSKKESVKDGKKEVSETSSVVTDDAEDLLSIISVKDSSVDVATVEKLFASIADKV